MTGRWECALTGACAALMLIAVGAAGAVLFGIMKVSDRAATAMGHPALGLPVFLALLAVSMLALGIAIDLARAAWRRQRASDKVK